MGVTCTISTQFSKCSRGITRSECPHYQYGNQVKSLSDVNAPKDISLLAQRLLPPHRSPRPLHRPQRQTTGLSVPWHLPLGAGHGLLHCRVEEGVAEEVEGTAEDDPGVVPGLEPSNQEGVLPHCMGVLGATCGCHPRGPGRRTAAGPSAQEDSGLDLRHHSARSPLPASPALAACASLLSSLQ